MQLVVPSAIEPLPVIFCNVDGGRTLISVSLLKRSPNALTVVIILPMPIVGAAVTWNNVVLSLFGFSEIACAGLPIILKGPSTLSVAVPLAAFDVVFVIVTGNSAVSPGLRKRGNAALNTMG